MLNGLIDWITRVIGDHGFPAVLGLMTLESACIPVPSEVIQLFAGYLVSLHRMSLFAAVSAGVLGNLIGSWIAWSVGYYGGRPVHRALGPLRPRHPRPSGARRALVRQARRGHGARRALRPGHPHLHLAAGRHRAHAVLALHAVHAARLHPLGARADAARRAGRARRGSAGATGSSTSTTSWRQ